MSPRGDQPVNKAMVTPTSTSNFWHRKLQQVLGYEMTVPESAVAPAAA
jgi:hypothetical protein